MNSKDVGLIILACISIGMATLCHFTIHSFILASLTSAFISAGLFQFADYIEVGYLDPFFLIGLVTGAFYALLISVPVGFATRFIVRRRPGS